MTRFAVVAAIGIACGLVPGSARGAGYDRPAVNPHQSRSVTVAQHGIVATSQPLAAEVGLDILKQRRQCGRRGHRHQRHARPGRADELRHRRRSVRHLLGHQNAKALRPQRQRPQPLQAQPRGLQGEGPDRDSRRRACCAGRCPAAWHGWEDLRARFGTQAAGRDSCSRRSPMPTTVFRSPRSSPTAGADRPRACASGPTRPRPICPTGTPPVEGEIFRNPRPGRQLSRDRQRRARRRSTKARSRKKIVAFSEANGGYFSLQGLRRPSLATGSSRSRRTIAATTCGSCRPTARASPPCKCSTCSSRTTCARWAAAVAE